MAPGERSDSQADTAPETAPPLERLPLHSTDLLTLLDASGVVQYESPSIERLYGFDQDELVGERVAEYFHPEAREGRDGNGFPLPWLLAALPVGAGLVVLAVYRRGGNEG